MEGLSPEAIDYLQCMMAVEEHADKNRTNFDIAFDLSVIIGIVGMLIYIF